MAVTDREQYTKRQGKARVRPQSHFKVSNSGLNLIVVCKHHKVPTKLLMIIQTCTFQTNIDI